MNASLIYLQCATAPLFRLTLEQSETVKRRTESENIAKRQVKRNYSNFCRALNRLRIFHAVVPSTMCPGARLPSSMIIPRPSRPMLQALSMPACSEWHSDPSIISKMRPPEDARILVVIGVSPSQLHLMVLPEPSNLLKVIIWLG